MDKAQNQADGRYMILSSDTHAGAQTRTYKEFLDPAWHDEFDAWEAAITNPWVDLRDMDAAKVNWDSDARTAACDAEGITGEVLFPNTLTPFYDFLVHLSGVPDTIMWGADFPHDEGSIGYTTEALAATMWDVPVEECRKMLTDVAAELYRFDTEALAPTADRIGPQVSEVHTPPFELPESKSLLFNTDPPLESVITF